jgi:hypothetical protein
MAQQATKESLAKSSGLSISDRMASAGYNLSDLGRVAKTGASFSAGGSEQAAVSKTIDKLMSSKSDTDVILAQTLQSLQKTIADNTAELKNVASEYANATTVEEKQAAESKMKVLMGTIDPAAEGVRDIMRHGGGGGEGPGGIRSALSRYAGPAAAVLGVASAAANMYMQSGLAQDRAVYGGELRAARAAGQVSGSLFNMVGESRDMTKSENILRYGADVLMPGRKFDFIGKSGLENSRKLAENMLIMSREMEKTERTVGVAQGAASAATGAVMVGAGAASGGLATMAVAPGMNQVMGGTSSMASSFFGSPTTAREGGLDRG